MDKKGALPVLAILTGVGLILFWIGFFTVGLAPENPPPGYFEYEHSFPLPDIILALALIVAGVLMLRGNEVGGKIATVCSGSLIFLGLLDFSFNYQNGIYALSTAELLLNGFINLWCVLFGLVMAIKGIRGRLA
ncbi:MAG TPA: hypothetical protein PKO38_02980 [Bacillota bacterium]|jgi:hypothetical protein|nr:hypothetical protein [Bacillota bacterium]HOB86638.1 hypothetical protein [Bacillota bacterium]HOP69372.1 hypothetical protein [Bacillota bacterium]HPT33715.1 hypothetical protein [Bacillota bacterium]HPZ64861.1 hypothetical protein [Bacillota bacterium]